MGLSFCGKKNMRGMDNSEKRPIWLTCLRFSMSFVSFVSWAPKLQVQCDPSWQHEWVAPILRYVWPCPLESLCDRDNGDLARCCWCRTWSCQSTLGSVLCGALDLHLKDFTKVAVGCDGLKLRTSKWFAQHAVVACSCLKMPQATRLVRWPLPSAAKE